ncbi:hypothetical protein DPMN_178856 [Dreissena polymorpha]|uniref:Uncharacterized protein n=1 Tax=Dreissena polymorpha TaxID=45954 RepID=A0A9D4ECZ5_DREPO|nr:hypothetical protein DPMN_178856 [Dreissena polymorpha]
MKSQRDEEIRHVFRSSAGLPFVLDAGLTAEWSLSAEARYAQYSSETHEESWKWPMKCPPKSKILQKASLYSDVIST